jgi:ribonuclease BN (tRNA processing enzyme)
MKIQVVESTVGQSARHQFAVSYLINDTVAIDAGCIGFMHPIARQRQVSHVLLTHSHFDHIASLPVFLENVYSPTGAAVVLCAGEETQRAVETHVFNDMIWPDLVRIAQTEAPFFTWQTLREFETFQIGNLSVTPIPLQHLVPTFGFLVDDGHSAVAIVSDTAPVTEAWDFLNQQPNLHAVFLELSFPESMAGLAEHTMHLTPSTFLREQSKLARDVDWLAVHLKSTLREEILSDFSAISDSPIVVAEPGTEYSF